MPETVRIGLKLFLITAIATLALAWTHMITDVPIRAQVEKAATEARQAVLPDAGEFQQMKVSSSGQYPSILEAYKGLDGSQTVGYTFKLSGKGYGGDLEIIAGIRTNGKLAGIRILQNSETPGLGAESQKPEFYEQYSGKSASKPLENEDISAITGATVTTHAVTNTVNTAIKYFNTELGGGKQ